MVIGKMQRTVGGRSPNALVFAVYQLPGTNDRDDLRLWIGSCVLVWLELVAGMSRLALGKSAQLWLGVRINDDNVVDGERMKGQGV